MSAMDCRRADFVIGLLVRGRLGVGGGCGFYSVSHSIFTVMVWGGLEGKRKLVFWEKRQPLPA